MLSRRELLATSTAPALIGAWGERPNVMVVVMDDLGCRDLGYLGAKDMRTPNIDALADAAVRFPNWYSNAPVCAPSRASIVSGRYPARAGVPQNGGNLTPGIPTLGSQFKANGYRTAAIGKWHLGESDETCPNGHGFDYFYGFHNGCIDFYSHRYYWGEPKRVNFHDLWRNRAEIFEDGRYFTERITEETVEFVNRAKGSPFCAYVAYNAPHYPMHAPEKYVRRFAALPPERRVYAAMVAAVDDGIGQIRKALEANGQAENTLLFFVGDNGATTERRAGLNQEFATAGQRAVQGIQVQPVRRRSARAGLRALAGEIQERKGGWGGRAVDGHSADGTGWGRVGGSRGDGRGVADAAAGRWEGVARGAVLESGRADGCS